MNHSNEHVQRGNLSWVVNPIVCDDIESIYASNVFASNALEDRQIAIGILCESARETADGLSIRLRMRSIPERR